MCRLQYHPQFQASTGGLGMYSSRIMGGLLYCCSALRDLVSLLHSLSPGHFKSLTLPGHIFILDSLFFALSPDGLLLA